MTNVLKKANLKVVSDIKAKVDNAEENIKGSTINIPLNLIKRSENNNFSIVDIDKLADSLKEFGLIHNIVVREIDDPIYRYELISGERRYLAAQKLGWETIEAKVKTTDDLDSEILLITANLETRELDDIERSENAIRLAELIKMKRKSGEDFGGKKTREIIAEKMNIPPAQVQKLMKLKELIPEMKQLVKDGILSLETSNQYAQMPADVQKLIYDSIQQGISFTAKEAKELKDKLAKVQKDTDKHLAILQDRLFDKENELKAVKEKAQKDLQVKDEQLKAQQETINKLQDNINSKEDELIFLKNELDNKSLNAEKLRDEIKAELENALKSQQQDSSEVNNKAVEELKAKLIEAEKNIEVIKSEYDEKILEKESEIQSLKEENNSLIDEYEKRLKEKKQKEINQQNIEINMELLALCKQVNQVVGTLYSKVTEAKSKEGFKMTDEVKKAIANIGQFGNNIINANKQ